MQRTDLKRIIRRRVIIWLGSAAAVFVLALIGTLVHAIATGNTGVNQILLVITMSVILALLPALLLAVILGGLDVGMLIGLKDAANMPVWLKALIPAGLIFVTGMLMLGSLSSLVLVGLPNPMAVYAVGALGAIVIAAFVFRSHLRFGRMWPAAPAPEQ